jgi:hypothetical protein
LVRGKRPKVVPPRLIILPDAPLRSSSVIDRLEDSERQSLTVYFDFDFKDERKQSLSGLLASLVFQLATCSRACFDILTVARARTQKIRDGMPNKSHAGAHLHATDDLLIECVESMLRASSEIFIIIDALDECPETTRETDYLPFLRKLVAFGIPGLHLFVTSRPERDILLCMDNLASHPLDLNKAHERNGELLRFISHELSSPIYYRNWPLEIKAQAERILVEKARGM